MFCSNCGTELPGGARFCPGCGVRLALPRPAARNVLRPAPGVPAPEPDPPVIRPLQPRNVLRPAPGREEDGEIGEAGREGRS